MFVKLRRDLYIGERLFKARSYGVEIPDEIEGKPVVAHSEKGEGKIALPKDAVILNAAPKEKKAKDPKVALSEMVAKAAAPQSFNAAMKKIDEDED